MSAPTATLELDPVGSFRAEVINRALEHGQFHVDRGIGRGIDVPDMEGAETVFMLALHTLAEAESETDRATALSAAHDALDEWKLILESLSDGRESGYTDQCVEVDQGELRTLLRCIAALDWLSSAETKATMSERQILINLAAEGFACPLYPGAAEAE